MGITLSEVLSEIWKLLKEFNGYIILMKFFTFVCGNFERLNCQFRKVLILVASGWKWKLHLPIFAVFGIMDTTIYITKVLLIMFITQKALCVPNPQQSQPLKDNYLKYSPEIFVPYNFIFNHNDGLGTMQHREEKKDEDGVVRGSYGYRDAWGTYRHVSYEAGRNGFKAVVRTNEPGVKNRNSADVAVVAESPSLRIRQSIPVNGDAIK